jgi:aminomethyltransferase
MEKTTPLTAWHQAHHGTMVAFGGYLMPVQYEKGIMHEHRLVRTQCGLFDVCHMGEFVLSGEDALANLNYWCSNDYTSLDIGAIRYGILVREDGSAVDDLLVYRLAEHAYLLVVNASNRDKDFAYIREHLFGQAHLQDLSDTFGLIALQGPSSLAVMQMLCDQCDIPYYQFKSQVDVGGYSVLLSRTGYTGEDGFELYCDAKDTVALWELLLKTGEDFGLEPCGLGARDTLRLEAAMPLYGHELDDQTTPLEAGLSMFVKKDKPHFIAQSALSVAPLRKRIGLVMIDRGIAREHCDVFVGDTKVGVISSGTMSPSLNKAIAMAIVDAAYASEHEFSVDVRGRRIKAERVKLPFYKR